MLLLGCVGGCFGLLFCWVCCGFGCEFGIDALHVSGVCVVLPGWVAF